MKLLLNSVWLLFLMVLTVVSVRAADSPMTTPTDSAKPVSFEAAADKALAAMKARAEELKIHGAAVIAYGAGEQMGAWSSKMMAVGQMTNPPKENKKGDNLLAIAYAKAAEMAATLKDSGNAGRPTMTGELGWRGGKIARVKSGYLIAAFSGGSSDDDVKVSQAGLDAIAAEL